MRTATDNLIIGVATKGMTLDMQSFDDGETEGAPRRRRGRRLSELFAQLSRDANGQVSIAQIRNAMGNRSFAPLLVLFAAFNLIPLPPGTSAILGIPLIIVSAQMVYGIEAGMAALVGDEPVAERGAVPQESMDWLIPHLIRFERLIRPRYWPFWRRRGDRVIGVPRADAGDHRHLAHPARQLAAGVRDRAAWACAV